MALSLNKVILIGNVGVDPIVRVTQSGNNVVSLSLATSSSWKDKGSNEFKEKTEWHKIVVFNENLVNLIKNFVKKGSKLYVEGKLHTRSYQDNKGETKYITEIVLQGFDSNLIILDNKTPKDGEENKADIVHPSSDFLDDEIPF